MSDRTIEQKLGDWIMRTAQTVEEIAEISGLIVNLKEQEFSRGVVSAFQQQEKNREALVNR